MTKDRRRRRQVRQAERRKQKRWRRALAGLDDPVILLLEADQMDRVPMSFLPLPKLKERIGNYNMVLEFARTDGPNAPRDIVSSPDSGINLRPPILMQSRSPIDLALLKMVHARGRRAYDWLVARGEVTPRAGSGWSLIYHRDMMSSLPSINLQWKRRRDRYLVDLVRDEEGHIVSIRAYSTTWCPLFERRIHWPESAGAGVTATNFTDFPNL